MSDELRGGPDWYYAIPGHRRERYENAREYHRSRWWGLRLSDPKAAKDHLDAYDELSNRLALDYPPPVYRLKP